MTIYAHFVITCYIYIVISGICKQQGTTNVFKENGETDNRLTKKAE